MLRIISVMSVSILRSIFQSVGVVPLERFPCLVELKLPSTSAGFHQSLGNAPTSFAARGIDVFRCLLFELFSDPFLGWSPSLYDCSRQFFGRGGRRHHR